MKINRQWLGQVFRNQEQGAGDGAASGGTPNESGNDNIGNNDAGGDGGNTDSGSESWLSAVSEEYRPQLEKNGIKDVGGLAKQFVDLQSHLGNSIRVPGPDAGDEDKAAFYEKIQKHAPDLMPKPVDDDSKAAIWQSLGKPGEASEYDVEVPEALSQAIGDERIEQFREIAHKHNLTKDQFQGVVGEILAADAQNYEAAVNAQKEGQNALRTKWGDAYEQRMGEIAGMMEQTGAPESLTKAVQEGNIDAAALEWIHGLHGRMDQDEGQNLSRDQGQGRLTPDEAENQLQEILNNRQHAYWDAGHPDHQRAIEKVTKLGRAARPQTANRKIGSTAFEVVGR